MAVFFVGPTFLARLFRHFFRGEQPAGRVQVSIRLLGGGDFGDHSIQVAVQRRIGMHRQGVGGTFDDLVNVRVIIDHAHEFPRHECGGLGEVVNTPGFLTFPDIGFQRDPPVGFHPR